MANNGSSSNATSADAVNLASQQVATVYARALLGATESAGVSETVLGELDSLIDDVLNAFPKIEAVFASKFVSAEDKIAMIDRALGTRASKLLVNFLKVLATHERLEHLRAIRTEARKQLDQLRGRVQVVVRTAAPLAADESQQVLVQLRRMIGGEPYLVEQIDPGLIGGIVLQAGDTVFDGSIATRLSRIQEQMIDRSVHEIQRRRDRFSTAAGN